VNYAGTLLDRFHEARPAKEKSSVDFVERLRIGVRRLAERSGLHLNALRTVSITTKGVVDTDSPTVLWSPVFNDQTIDFKMGLRQAMQTQIHVHNETTFSAQAVASRLRRSQTTVEPGRRIAVLSIGHSIGLGVATFKSQGRIETFAPPFSHMLDQQNGPLCRCGARGCVEATAGFYGILRSAFGVPIDTLPAPFVPLSEVDKLAARARSGERNAEYAFRSASESLGLALARLNSLLSVSEVTITGRGAKFIDLLLPGLQRGLEQTMQARQGRLPKIHVELDETHLIHEGNTQWCLASLDAHRVATRQFTGIQAVGI